MAEPPGFLKDRIAQRSLIQATATLDDATIRGKNFRFASRYVTHVVRSAATRGVAITAILMSGRFSFQWLSRRAGERLLSVLFKVTTSLRRLWTYVCAGKSFVSLHITDKTTLFALARRGGLHGKVASMSKNPSAAVSSASAAERVETTVSQ
ncbi:hypothetical protein J6590_104000 [Homalodisca vitripennis]|nr:hypothetical protein J6590_104000 [Homalodisca vitripennis]